MKAVLVAVMASIMLFIGVAGSTIGAFDAAPIAHAGDQDGGD